MCIEWASIIHIEMASRYHIFTGKFIYIYVYVYIFIYINIYIKMYAYI